MLTAFLLALGMVALLGVSARMAYRVGFREGHEQGLTDSYRLFGIRGAGPEGKPHNKEPEKIGA